MPCKWGILTEWLRHGVFERDDYAIERFTDLVFGALAAYDWPTLVVGDRP